MRWIVISSLMVAVAPQQQIFNDGNVNHCPPCNCVCNCTIDRWSWPPCVPVPCTPCADCPTLIQSPLPARLGSAAAECLSGPGASPDPPCRVFDVDVDDDVDLVDFARFQGGL
ncbi:MAG: hypothetical protein AABZ12_03465 [Planctomycetota bacterium]